MAVRSFQVLGIELAPYVLDWGSVEQVKDVLLAQAQLFTSEHTLTLANTDKRFSKDNSKSIFYNRNLQLLPVTLGLDGETLYKGYIRSVPLDHATRTARITSQNAFTIPASTSVLLTEAGANPASVIQSILEQVGLGNDLDASSFNAAKSVFSAAGATIDVNVGNGSTNTALGLIQSITSLCSLSCFTRGDKIILRHWIPYQGNLSGVKFQITSAQVYDFGEIAEQYQSLVNQVRVLYGASGVLTLTNAASVKTNGITTATELSCATGSEVAFPDLASAQFLGQRYLDRASTVRRQAEFTGGIKLMSMNIGDRISILAPNWSTSPLPFEVLATHANLNDLSVGVTCASL